MKAFIASALVLFSAASSFAQPYSETQILSVTQSANMMPPLPPQGPTVRTTIEVGYQACSTFSERNFDLAFAREGGDQHVTMLVNIAPDTIDCMGPAFFRKIKLERTNMPLMEKVNVLRNGKLVTLDVVQNLVH